MREFFFDTFNRVPGLWEYDSPLMFDAAFDAAGFYMGDDSIIRRFNVRLLVPDTTYEQREDHIWCLPIEPYEFDRLADLASKFKCKTHNDVPFLHRFGRARKRVLLVMWHPVAHSREEIVEACAWLRLIKDYQFPIYVLPCRSLHEEPLTTQQVIARSMGALPEQVQSLDSLTGVTEEDE